MTEAHINATQWNAHGDPAVAEWTSASQVPCDKCGTPFLLVDERGKAWTHGCILWPGGQHMRHIVCPGNWIVRGNDGEWHPSQGSKP